VQLTVLAQNSDPKARIFQQTINHKVKTSNTKPFFEKEYSNIVHTLKQTKSTNESKWCKLFYKHNESNNLDRNNTVE